ncbi:putative membrane protein DUF2339 [Dysgonomonas alginatilytica]|uniref:Putative membrane protein DUF2339 n=1 Tax=Dysgonomonas alginatilytica TaxID=1605892 RepID=A0A2V3PU50_9BACT|nr:DUF2339 domain-containing protein [Dysgonomonas alginatilytica]PXV69153.1 putative membrane protein DUF2339 [Dysgonomonas alginatilytica]
MDSIIIIVISLLVLAAVVPFFLLFKIWKLTKKVTYLFNHIIEIGTNTKQLLDRSADKKDIQKILDAIQNLEDKYQVAQLADSIQPIEKAVENIASQKEEKPSTPIISEAEEKIIEIPQAEETFTETIDREPEEQPVYETPAYAAFNNTGNKPQTSFSEVFQQPAVAEKPQNKENNQESEKGFIEKIFSENLLTKIGIVTLVLGIAFFVKYAIDQEWINEIGRVGIGLLTGGIIIAIAHKLKEKYQVFSSILVGGGISILYITVTLAFREYELFSQPIAFALLIAITIFSVILSLYYDRKELAIFSLLGGFASPLMISTGSGNYIVLFSYILILNSGMLILTFRKKWHVIGIISYALTLIFFWSWLLISFESQFKGATLFAGLFFAQFYILALADHFRGEHKITSYQGMLILTNNLSFFLACLTIFSDFTYDINGLITIIIAAINAVIMITLFRKSEIDRNLIYLIIGVVMTFVNLAIPIQMNGYVITMFWAVEMAVLLWLWQKSQIQIFRVGFFIVTGLVICSYLIDITHNYVPTFTPMPVILNSVCITGLVVIASFFVSKLLLRKEDGNSVIEIGNRRLFRTKDYTCAIGLILILFTYLVPFLEINYHIQYRLELDYNISLRYVIMTAYTSVYVSILSFLYRKEIEKRSMLFGLLSIFTVIYSLVYWYYVTELRDNTFGFPAYPKAYFLLHFVALIPLTFIIATLIRNVKSAVPGKLKPFYWGMTIISTLLLGIETENISVMIFSNTNNYSDVLYDVRTFVFPVLWALIAMGLMIWGLKGKEVILRKISLIFFALIIVKFYAYDVWHMSQAGRIVSFIMLGVIILLVSFLQQKIKTLVKADTPENEQ